MKNSQKGVWSAQKSIFTIFNRAKKIVKNYLCDDPRQSKISFEIKEFSGHTFVRMEVGSSGVIVIPCPKNLVKFLPSWPKNEKNEKLTKAKKQFFRYY